MEAVKEIEKQNSVEISINAKGLWSGKVKVYEAEIEDAMKKALEKAKQLEGVINEKNK